MYFPALLRSLMHGQMENKQCDQWHWHRNLLVTVTDGHLCETVDSFNLTSIMTVI